ncbi:MAG TPA: CheR family methyltransferase [Nitrospiria bacterium]|jgi:chemotaxis protein methyltransferase CheR|nr:CheR family methyltransferase [Nitrospiria bacterium]
MNEELVGVEKQIELPVDVFRILRDMLYEQSGVYLNDNSKFFLESRLQHSVRRQQFDNFKDYYYFLKYDRKKDEELTNFIDLLTIHETFFFREERQLKAFGEEILPELAERKKKQRSLRIWSAGCSTGEEPYTIAMLIAEQDALKGWDIEIFASDISQRVLQSARRGIYQPSAFRSTDPRYIANYFHTEGTGYRIDDRIKQSVTFLGLNLLDTCKLALISMMDVIYCRNVIIYFDKAAKKKVVAVFHQKLKNHGYLLLGHSESLINISTAFALRHFKHDLVYQKIECADPGLPKP